MITMKKWGTKSEIGGAIISIALVVDAIYELNAYLLIVSAITGLILIFSSVYDWYKKTRKEKVKLS